MGPCSQEEPSLGGLEAAAGGVPDPVLVLTLLPVQRGGRALESSGESKSCRVNTA